MPAAAAPEFARRPAQTLWIGPGHHLVHYPVSAGELFYEYDPDATLDDAIAAR